jgi:tRNA A37 threonylcarbamoyladenosine biosynthesis protein TsaE
MLHSRIYHLDLYRLSGSGQELLPLDLDNVFRNCISLIEWPSRLTEKPDNRLDVTLTIEPGAEMDDLESRSRIMKLEPFGERWLERLRFLEKEGYLDDLLIESCLIKDGN